MTGAAAQRGAAGCAARSPSSVVAVLAMFPIAGIPLAWVIHLRIAVSSPTRSARACRRCRSVARARTPGSTSGSRTVIVLGAAILLLDAALLLAFAPRPARRRSAAAGAALPLIALAVVPATLVRPAASPTCRGCSCSRCWPRSCGASGSRADAWRRALALCARRGRAVGMIAAPALDQHTPWLNYEALAGGARARRTSRRSTGRSATDRCIWPRTGQDVLDVQARARADYWKAENLDVVRRPRLGRPAPSERRPGRPAVEPAALARWTQTLTVTIRAMRTTQGDRRRRRGATPSTCRAPALPGVERRDLDRPPSALGPGDSYTVSAYAPHPSAGAAARRPATDYPAQPVQRT